MSEAPTTAPRLIPALSSSGDALDRRTWLEVAIDRLNFVVLVALGAGVAAWPFFLLRQPNEGVRAGTERPGYLLPIWIAVCVGLLVALRLKKLSNERKLDLGLAALVITCFAVALFRHFLPYDASDVVRGASPIAVALLFFSAVVPVPPRKMAITAAFCVAADFLALGLTISFLGNPNPPWNLWLWLHITDFLVAPVGVITSWSLFQLREEVEEARALGSYRLVKKLGAGGMGEVWLAEHQALARPAAVKLIQAQGGAGNDPERIERAIRRFKREAQATAGLTSPHTIRLYDFGEAEDGSFFYAMELLDGMDLDELLQRHGRLPVARAVHFLKQACHSLSEAHDQGIVHRDIKPANLFVSRMGLERDFLKVLDFGLVHVESNALDSKLTADGSVVGSPGYMAPEMIRAQRIDARTDIYAIGCVAYHLLSGRMVFEGKNAVDVMIAHVQDAPTQLSDAFDGPLPTALEALVMQCIEKSPDARPDAISEVLARLGALELDKDWTDAHAREWWQTHGKGDNSTLRIATDPTLAPDAPTATIAGRETVDSGFGETVDSGFGETMDSGCGETVDSGLDETLDSGVGGTLQG